MMKLLAATALSLALATPALACDDHGPLNVPREQWLSVSEVVQKLETQGYKIHEIEVDDGAYEFEGFTAEGVKVEACAHPATGEILTGR